LAWRQPDEPRVQRPEICRIKAAAEAWKKEGRVMSVDRLFFPFRRDGIDAASGLAVLPACGPQGLICFPKKQRARWS